MPAENTPRRTRVAVVFGGRSGEHAVSVLSARSVLAQLDPEEFEVTAVGITRDGAWVRVDPAAVIDASPAGRELPSVPPGTAVVLPPDPTGAGIACLVQADVVFPLLHGPFGEDGTIQGLLELAGVPYVGPGVLASAAGMDKEFTKKLLAAEGLPVVPGVVLRPGNPGGLAAADRERLGLPVFVKPARAGSSLGVTRVSRWADLPAAIEAARRVDPKVLIEAAAPPREIECAVLEFPDGGVRAAPPAEIRVGGEHHFYDFEAKYLDDTATFDIPAELPEAVLDEVCRLAVRAFAALDAQGLARVDFFVGAGGELTINEVNTMPGFTPISMFPRMWAAAGLDYRELLTVLVRTAIARGTGLR